MKIEKIINSLNDEQRKAVEIKENAVVSAGAGSGKTKTLSARYLRLVIEEKMEVQSILALTFTKKAATEMNERIYSDLKNLKDTEEARKAIENFQKANICTLDSFWNSIARYSCKNYGIAPDFTIDQDMSKQIAEDVARSFFLRKIKEPILKELVEYKGIDEVLNGLFVTFLSNYTYISRPLIFEGMTTSQKTIIEHEKLNTLKKITEVVENIASLVEGTTKMLKSAREIAQKITGTVLSIDELNEELDKQSNTGNSDDCLSLYYELYSTRLVGNTKDETALLCKDLINEFRNLFQLLLNLYNYDVRLMENVFLLLDELQKEYINIKKRRGVLSYQDVAYLALDSLVDDLNLRTYYKKHIKSIMVDEFQDNNQLQKDILFLLAEKEDRCERSIPKADELERGKLFFVGDEKQSIYAFRGADVCVFRNLINELKIVDKTDNLKSVNDAKKGESKNTITLKANYRTEKSLVDIFNCLFPYVFYSDLNKIHENTPPFEAQFEPIEPIQNSKDIDSHLEVLYIDKTKVKNNEETEEPSINYEAYAIAERIKEMKDLKFKVRDKNSGNTRDCTWSDFCILLRTTTHQSTYERYLKMMEIPYTATTQKWIFSYAPLNDLYAMFRLSVYPQDKMCYAQVLKSPFVNISDIGFAEIMIDINETYERKQEKEQSSAQKRKAFHSSLAIFSCSFDMQCYKRGKEIFENVQEGLKTKNNAQILQYLWYESGYRYLLLSNPSYQTFLELYDYLFHLATLADASSKTHSEFIDLIEDYIKTKEKVDELDIPVNQKKDSLMIMSVHKSKGLEFPIVIIPNCDSSLQLSKRDAMIFYSKIAGLSLHSADKFANYRKKDNKTHSNYFFEMMREEENQKLLAELKRLFYVAMTRAEVKLILSGSVKSEAITAEEQQECKNQKANCLKEKPFSDFLIKAPKDEEGEFNLHSFFSLFSFALNRASITGQFRVENETLNFQDLKMSFYEINPNFDISILHAKKEKLSLQTHIERYKKLEIKSFDADEDLKIATAKISIDEKKDRILSFDEHDASMEIGEITHQYLEAVINNRDFDLSLFDLSKENCEKIEQYKHNFLSSEIGKKALVSTFKKTEYGFITEYKDAKEEKSHITRGVIDLFFESEGIIYIVDYKTDKKKQIERYKRQLSVYKKAVFDLCNTLYKPLSVLAKPVIKTYLFYLHFAECVEVDV